MLSEHDLARALERIGVSAPVRFDEVTRSTQLTALELARAGCPEWTLVAAGHQTEGRGRSGRTWLDRPGEALLFSLVLRPDLPPFRGGLLTLLAGWSVATACRRAAGVEAACRWPNDVLVEGSKVAGVLAESVVEDGRLSHVVLGVGVNLGAPPAGVPQAGALGRVEPAELLAGILEVFASRYAPADPAFGERVLSAYRDLCATLGRRVRATTITGTVVEGTAVGLDGEGGLQIETTGGLESVRFGEIEHLRD